MAKEKVKWSLWPKINKMVTRERKKIRSTYFLYNFEHVIITDWKIWDAVLCDILPPKNYIFLVSYKKRALYTWDTLYIVYISYSFYIEQYSRLNNLKFI